MISISSHETIALEDGPIRVGIGGSGVGVAMLLWVAMWKRGGDFERGQGVENSSKGFWGRYWVAIRGCLVEGAPWGGIGSQWGESWGSGMYLRRVGSKEGYRGGCGG